MPILPSLGLSSLIHFLVIIFTLIGRWAHLKRKGKRRQSFSSNIVGVFIIISVFTIILMGASKIIGLSIKDDNNSIVLAKKGADVVMAMIYEIDNKNNINIKNTNDANASDINNPGSGNNYLNNVLTVNANSKDSYSVEQEDCQIDFYNFAAGNEWSVVNYLVAKNIPYSLKDRKIIAQGLGMAEYNGNDAQNMELLKRLFNKEVALNFPRKVICLL